MPVVPVVAVVFVTVVPSTVLVLRTVLVFLVLAVRQRAGRRRGPHYITPLLSQAYPLLDTLLRAFVARRLGAGRARHTLRPSVARDCTKLRRRRRVVTLGQPLRAVLNRDLRSCLMIHSRTILALLSTPSPITRRTKPPF